MTFGTQSSIFRQFLRDALEQTASFLPHLASGGTWKAALYGDTGTPDNDVAANLSAYNTGQWVSGNELVDATNWVAGGRALAWGTATRWAATADTLTFDADDTAGGGNVTINNAWGDLVYDSAAGAAQANQGLAYHSFGAAKSVTGGTFTIVWHANGVARWQTLAA